MKLKLLVIDFEISQSAKKRVLKLAVPLLVLLASTIAYASSLHVWSSGDTLKSADLNSNFALLQSQITALQSFQSQATSSGRYSLGATFCGFTPSTTGAFSGPGNLVGYSSARAQCQLVSGCSATAAHICTADEMVRTSQLGQAIGAGGASYGWFASGYLSSYSQGYQDDCEGWTTSAGAEFGPAWQIAENAPSDEYCSIAFPILCCN